MVQTHGDFSGLWFPLNSIALANSLQVGHLHFNQTSCALEFFSGLPGFHLHEILSLTYPGRSQKLQTSGALDFSICQASFEGGVV